MRSGRLRTFARGVAVALLALRLVPIRACAPALAAPREAGHAVEPSAEARARVAAALDVPAARVIDALQLTVGRGVTVLLSSVRATAGDAHAVVIVGRVCAKNSFCAQRVLHIEEAPRVVSVALLDLAPPSPTSLTLRADAPPATGNTSKMRTPALLLRARHEQEGPDGVSSVEQLLLVTLAGPASSVVLSEQSARRASSGEGFETVSLRVEKATRGHADLVLVQHALPTRAASEQLPGPPLALRFRAAGNSYRRMSP